MCMGEWDQVYWSLSTCVYGRMDKVYVNVGTCVYGRMGMRVIRAMCEVITTAPDE